MSTDSALQTAIICKEHDIAQIVSSRKRKLCELYAVASTAEVIPPLFDITNPSISSHNSALTSFLNHNDLEKGRYFDEASLPSRPDFNLTSSASHVSEPLTQGRFTSGQEVDQHHASNRASVKEDPRQALAQSASLQPPTFLEEPIAQSEASEGATGISVEMGPAADQRELPPKIARINTGLSTSSSSTHRRTKPSKPDSPPYSPDAARYNDSASRLDPANATSPDMPLNILTPRKDENESASGSEASAAVRSAEVVGSAAPMVNSADVPTESASTPSSTAERPSTDASRREAHSPATSPEDDVEPSERHRASRNITGTGCDQSTDGHAPVKNIDRPDEIMMDSGTRHAHATHQAMDRAMDNDRQPLLEQHPNVEQTADRGGEYHARHKSSAKINKYKRHGTTKKVILAATKKGERWQKHEARIVSMARKPSLAVEYYRPFAAREALNTHHGKSLQALMEARTKTLSTAEREVGRREEAARNVLMRIQHLQNSGRWSLRTLKPAVEPESPLTSWDHLLQEARWLRTDFKEERKFKLSAMKTLAGWCANFVSSDVEARKALSIDVVAGKASPSICYVGLLDTKIRLDDIAAHVKDDSRRMSSLAEPVPLDFDGRSVFFDSNLLESIPAFGHLGALESPSASRTDARTDPLDSLPPEVNVCALFGEGGKPALRRKMNVVNPFKPPNRIISQMPVQGFYETRNPSQWTSEDDELLRQNIRQTPANWLLISQELSSRSEFVPPSERRTPWECFERFITAETNPTDISQRPYLKPFYARYGQARLHFEESQRQLQLQLQQARENGQIAANVPHKPFPEPRKVDRKPSRRFMALLDAARRLARKRETATSKQERAQQAEARPTQFPAAANRVSTDPHHWSKKKLELEQKEAAEIIKIREHQNALRDAQRKQHAGYPASLSHGIGQQMQNGMSGSTTTANGHLAVPNVARYPRPVQQAMVGHNNMANGMMSRGQVPNQNRLPNGVQSQRQMPQSGQDGISSYLQQQAIQQRFQNGQHPLQSQASQIYQASRGSPSMNQHGGLQNSAEAPGDQASSPNLQQGPSHHHSGSSTSTHSQQALAAATGHSFPNVNGGRGISQALSSGAVPQLVQLENEFLRQNPGMMPEEARHRATEKLKQLALRQNALGAASGMTSPGQGQHQHQHQQQNQQMMQGGGSQSPYQQHAVPTPQMQSPFQQNGVLGSNHLTQHNNAHVGGMTQQHQQQAYQSAMRKQMYNQSIHQMPPQQPGNGMATSSSPHMVHPTAGFQGSNNRQMRPPSRSASGFEIPQYPQNDMQRSGSAAAQSPRPISAQGYGPQS